MDRTKIKGYLNLAQKAGAVVRGGDNLLTYKKRLYLVLVDECAAKSTQKIADKMRQKTKVVALSDLAGLTGYDCKIIALTNQGLSEAIEKVIEG